MASITHRLLEWMLDVVPSLNQKILCMDFAYGEKAEDCKMKEDAKACHDLNLSSFRLC